MVRGLLVGESRVSRASTDTNGTAEPGTTAVGSTPTARIAPSGRPAS
jgi:hypothetical protein